MDLFQALKKEYYNEIVKKYRIIHKKIKYEVILWLENKYKGK